MIDYISPWVGIPLFIVLVLILVWLKWRDYKNLMIIEAYKERNKDSQDNFNRLVEFNDELFGEVLTSRMTRNRPDITGRDTPIFDQLAPYYPAYEDTK